ncbi:MAG: OsmC family protein [Chloroflexi bacterium]|nr:OsmC family protein [Chloroflexota bacterium]
MGTVSLKLVAGQLMVGVDSFGHPLVIGSWPEQKPEWAGLKPSDLLLLAAASCSAYDVAMILSKQREPLEALEVQCAGTQEPEPPYQFTAIHLHYSVKGAVNPQKLARAIELSETKYCSVVNTLKASVRITSDYDIT